jgi:hypothetical protein
VIRGEGLSARTFPLPRDTRFLIGRFGHLVLSTRGVSKIHCGLTWDAGLGRFILVDYTGGSRTSVNDRAVQESHTLTPGDTIQIADYQFVFEPDDAATGQAT